MSRTTLALAVALLLALPACAGAEQRDAAPARPGRAETAGDAEAHGAATPGSDAALPERVLVKRASIDLEVDEPAKVLDEAERIAKANDGYVQTTWTDGERRARVSLRVAAPRLDAALAELAKLGSVESKSISAEDVTAEVVDLDARTKNLTALRDGLRKLLEKATGVQDVVAVERELSRVQGELDALEARLKLLRTTAALSSVDVSAERPHILGPLGYLGYGLWWGFSKLFLIR